MDKLPPNTVSLPSYGVSSGYRASPLSPLSLSLRLSDIDFNDVNTCLWLMSKIRGNILTKDNRINRLVSDRVRLQAAKLNYKPVLIEQYFITAVSGALFHSAVLASLGSGSVLSGLNDLQLNCLLCAWVLTKGQNKVFTGLNIAGFKKYGLDEINVSLVNLLDMGLIDKLNEIDIHKLTGKVIKNKKLHQHFYKISKRGSTMLKDYFSQYELIYNKIMSSKFNDDLLIALDNKKTGL